MAELGPPRMASTVARFCTPHVRRRYATAPVQNAEGLRVYVAPVATTLRAHVFPAGGTVSELAEGSETSDDIEFHSPDEWRGADEQTGLLADEIVHGGDIFEITTCDAWREGPAGDDVWLQCAAKRVTGRPAAV